MIDQSELTGIAQRFGEKVRAEFGPDYHVYGRQVGPTPLVKLSVAHARFVDDTGCAFSVNHMGFVGDVVEGALEKLREALR